MATQQTAAQGKLTAIATDMYAAIASGQAWHHRKLAHGLELVLQRNDNRWRLALGRDGVPVSDMEVGIVRRAFDVPPAVEPEASQKSRTMPTTGRQAIYHIVELCWLEQEPAVVG